MSAEPARMQDANERSPAEPQTVSAPRDRVVSIPGFKLFVRELGEGDPVLLINGLGANLEMWGPAQEKLADTALARSSYRKALDEQPDDLTYLDALIELDAAAGDHPALIDVLGRKADLVIDSRERARLLERKAIVWNASTHVP